MVTDNLGVVRRCRALLRGTARRGKHADLEAPLKRYLLAGLHVAWLRAHLTEAEAREAGVPLGDWCGNQQADLLAGWGSACQSQTLESQAQKQRTEAANWVRSFWKQVGPKLARPRAAGPAPAHPDPPPPEFGPEAPRRVGLRLLGLQERAPKEARDPPLAKRHL